MKSGSAESGRVGRWCYWGDLLHRRRKVLNIGGEGGQVSEYWGGGQVSEYWGGGGGGAGYKLIGTFFTLKTDDIAKLRIELKSILLEIPSNKIKGTYI